MSSLITVRGWSQSSGTTSFTRGSVILSQSLELQTLATLQPVKWLAASVKTQVELPRPLPSSIIKSGLYSRVIVNEENDKKTEESVELPDFIITCYF